MVQVAPKETFVIEPDDLPARSESAPQPKDELSRLRLMARAIIAHFEPVKLSKGNLKLSDLFLVGLIPEHEDIPATHGAFLSAMASRSYEVVIHNPVFLEGTPNEALVQMLLANGLGNASEYVKNSVAIGDPSSTAVALMQEGYAVVAGDEQQTHLYIDDVAPQVDSNIADPKVLIDQPEGLTVVHGLRYVGSTFAYM